MQRRVQQTHRHGQARHRGEDAFEIAALERQQLLQSAFELVLDLGVLFLDGLPGRVVFGGGKLLQIGRIIIGRQDHLPHRPDAVAFKEHVLGARQTDALGAEIPGPLCIGRRVRVGANAQRPDLVAHLHEFAEVAAQRGRNRRQLAVHHLAAGAVETDPVALLQGHLADVQLLAGVVDVEVAHAGDAALAHAAGDHRRVAGHAAERRQNALRRVHPANVLRAGFSANQNHFLAVLSPGLGHLGGEDNLADRRARRSRQTLANDVPFGLRVKLRMQQLVQLIGCNAHHGVFLGNQTLVDHVHRDLHGRRRGPFAGTGLEDIELLLLDGELHILHVLVVLLQARHEPGQLRVGLGHHLVELAQLDRRADAGHDVFALGVHQKLAVELLLARAGVAREADARAAVVAHVAEDHGLHVDGGAQQPLDVVQFAIADGARAVPRAEHRVDRMGQLDLSVLREHLADMVLVDLLVCFDHAVQLLGVEVAVQLHARPLLGLVDLLFEVVVVAAHHDVAEHVDEPTIDIVGETGVAGLLDNAFHHPIVQTEVQNRVHHAGHGRGGAASHADQQRTVRIAHLHPHGLFELGQVGVHLFVQPLGPFAFGLVVLAADLRRDGKARRDRNAQVGHLGQVGAFAPQELFHLGIAFRLPVAEEVHPFFCHACFLLLARVISARALLFRIGSANFTVARPRQRDRDFLPGR